MSDLIGNALLLAIGFALAMAWFNLEQVMLARRKKRLDEKNAVSGERVASSSPVPDQAYIAKLHELGDRFNAIAYRGMPKATMIELMQQWQKELDVQLSDRVWETVHVQLDQMERRRMDYVRAKIQSRR